MIIRIEIHFAHTKQGTIFHVNVPKWVHFAHTIYVNLARRRQLQKMVGMTSYHMFNKCF